MPSTQARPKVLIFRNEVLPSSETFILAQAKALRTFEPVFAGVHAAPHSLALDVAATLVSPSPTLSGKVMRHVYWRTSIAPKFYRHLRSIGLDLIHAHFAVDGAAALPVRARLGIPLIVTLHGYDVTSSEAFLRRSNEGRLYLRRRKELWARASLFLCISEFIRDKALEQGFPSEKLCTHYTGTDLDLFKLQPRTRDPHMILFVGRLVEKKGCTHLLEALARIRAQHPALHLVIIGTGPLEATLRQRVAAEGLPCKFLGMQAAHVVKDYMARARVFCVPSVAAANGDSEGLGMVFAEAQAMGTPIASFQHGGIPEVVRHGRNGLLAPEGDSEALGTNLLQLLRDDATWTSHSRAGVSWVHGQFDITKQTVELERIYRRVLKNWSR
jgi:glycosyltransferase involved in cell wall biosynthesis